MADIVYTLKEMAETEELHLFEATPAPDGKCTPKPKSICGAMKKGDSVANKFACKDEDDARMECARIGRDVCGNCVRHLYATY
ncbi:hypothetical protein [Caenispirillum salinarum]|uniref:hypothetical protein n=1 Tax=Caenispirillum salinarum TaxID=859058 RepID=UPI0038512AAD